MLKQQGDICDALIPDFSADIICTSKYRRSVRLKTQKVLILGGCVVDSNCLPIFPHQTDVAYLPVGKVGFVNPLLMHRIAYVHLYRKTSILSARDFGIVKIFIRDLYNLCIDQGCQKVHWAQVPMAERDSAGFVLKSRPVVVLKHGLHIPLMTNDGRFTSPGPTIVTKTGPGNLGNIPIYLPPNFRNEHIDTLIGPDQKNVIQDHARLCISHLFRSPH